MKKRIITWKEIKEKVKDLPKGKYYGVPRGGMYIAALLDPVDSPDEADYIIDDLVDSGATEKRYLEKYPTKPFIALYRKPENDTDWYVYPWEVKDEEKDIADHLLRIGQYLNIKLTIKE